MLTKLSPSNSIGKTLVLSSLLTGAYSNTFAQTLPVNNTRSEVLSKEASDSLKSTVLYQIKTKSEEDVYGKAYILSRDLKYRQKLDSRYKQIFGDNKILNKTDILSKDKKLANYIDMLDENGRNHLNQILAINNDTETMDEVEYKMLCTLTDAGLMSDANFDWHAFVTYKYIPTFEMNEFDKKAANDKQGLLEDLNSKYDKKNLDDVAKLISKYYFRTIYGANIINEYLGVYRGNELISGVIGSNGISYFPSNIAGLTIALDEWSGEVRIRSLIEKKEFNVYDWSGNFIQKRVGNSLLD